MSSNSLSDINSTKIISNLMEQNLDYQFNRDYRLPKETEENHEQRD